MTVYYRENLGHDAWESLEGSGHETSELPLLGLYFSMTVYCRENLGQDVWELPLLGLYFSVYRDRTIFFSQ